MKYEKFATAVNCMDGRVQEPVIKYLKKKYGVKYIDTITETGIVKHFNKPEKNPVILSIKNGIRISLDVHGSSVVAVSGHYGCAGNPAGKKEQYKQVKRAVKRIKSWKTGAAKVVGLWIDRNWKVKEIKGT